MSHKKATIKNQLIIIDYGYLNRCGNRNMAESYGNLAKSAYKTAMDYNCIVAS